MDKYDWTVEKKVVGIVVLVVLIVLLIVTPRETETEIDTETAVPVVVVDCEEGDDYFLVTGEDDEGNDWQYYDDHKLRNGHVMEVRFNEYQQIVDVKY